MYLAEIEEYKKKFDLFITYPKDKEIKKKLCAQIETLFIDYDRFTSYSVDNQSGWAFFPEEENTYTKEVKAYLTNRLLSILQHEVTYGPNHDKTIDMMFYDGVSVQQNVDVDCLYFYDNVERYK